MTNAAGQEWSCPQRAGMGWGAQEAKKNLELMPPARKVQWRILKGEPLVSKVMTLGGLG